MSVVLLLWLILSRIVREDCEEGQGGVGEINGRIERR